MKLWIIVAFVLLQPLAFAGWSQTRRPWVRFAGAQVFQIEAAILGWLVLIPFCLTQAWKLGQQSIKDTRVIDVWSWGPLNLVYGNPEDGVSGWSALVNGDQKYMPNAWKPWRAYCWSALRNSCDNLKYVFAVPGAPLITFRLFGRTAKIGWQVENGFNVPVFSL